MTDFHTGQKVKVNVTGEILYVEDVLPKFGFVKLSNGASACTKSISPHLGFDERFDLSNPLRSAGNIANAAILKAMRH